MGECFLGGGLVGGAKIQTGSYVGNGKFGSDNPNSLTFDFEPKLVIISADSLYPSQYGGWLFGVIWHRGMSYSYANSYVTNGEIHFTLSGKTLSWYSPANPASYQLNANGMTYYYTAIGE